LHGKGGGWAQIIRQHRNSGTMYSVDVEHEWGLLKSSLVGSLQSSFKIQKSHLVVLDGVHVAAVVEQGDGRVHRTSCIFQFSNTVIV